MQNKPEYTRNLPHYHLYGATFFVTFRLFGSLPLEFLEKLSDWYELEKRGLIWEKKLRTKKKRMPSLSGIISENSIRL